MMEEKKKRKSLHINIDTTGLVGMFKFALSDKRRDRVIRHAPIKEITAEFAINKHAKAQHPDALHLRVAEIIDMPAAGAKKIVLASENGEDLPYFRAGQYLSLRFHINGSTATRAYSICSSPAMAKHGIYAVTVRAVKDGFVSDYVLNHLQRGDMVVASAPEGQFYYEPVRDARTVVAIAGGSGITPFLSMAYAIEQKIEDFNLILLYGARTKDSLLFYEELETIRSHTDRVKPVYILSEEECEGFEHGFISAELIRKYAPWGDYSVFLCGPEGLYSYEADELKKLQIPARRIRQELQSVVKCVSCRPDYPADCAGKTFTLTLHRWGETFTIPCLADEPILVAIERAGIVTPSRCRNGSCGWCRSKLLAGDVYVPSESEARRWGDREFGYIHPCCSFPVSDVEVDVPGETE